MGKFDGMLFCTDLDGTLLRGDKTISHENLEAIEYFKAQGGLFTFITGRMPFFSSKMYEAIRPNAPVGCINGGGVYDYRTGQYLWQQPMPQSVVELIQYAHDLVPEIGIQVNVFDKLYFCTENSCMVRFRERTGVPHLTADYHKVSEPIAKIVFGDLNVEHIEKLQELLPKHPRAKEFGFIRSERTLFEILPPGVNKGTLLAKLAELTGVDMRRTVATGDYNNDASMLRAAGLGVAVANAVPETLAAADYVTVSNEEHAIAAVINDIEQGRVKL